MLTNIYYLNAWHIYMVYTYLNWHVVINKTLTPFFYEILHKLNFIFTKKKKKIVLLSNFFYNLNIILKKLS